MKPEETSGVMPTQDLMPDRFQSSHVDVITAYIALGGEGIVLSDLQLKLLDRYRFADEKLRQGHGRFKREDIAGMIRTTFGVSRDTAYKDIVNAENIFCSSYPLNKQYEIGIRIEFLKEKIRLAAAENAWDSVARLEKVLLGYYDIYPNIKTGDTKKNIIMNVLQQFFTQPADNTMALDDAIQIAETIEDDNSEDINDDNNE